MSVAYSMTTAHIWYPRWDVTVHCPAYEDYRVGTKYDYERVIGRIPWPIWLKKSTS